MQNDGELLAAWRAGDMAAGEALFDRYYTSLVRFFRNKTASDWDDLVQQTFMTCVKGRDAIRSASSFRAYLFGVAYNVLRSHFRSIARRGGHLDFDEVSVADLAPGPGTIATRRRESRILLEALRRIPIDHQVLLELRYWEQLKTREIADILGIPHPTLRTRLRRAHELLERALTELAANTDELASTLSDLERWARQCRDHLSEPTEP